MAFISCNHNGVVYHASTLLEGEIGRASCRERV